MPVAQFIPARSPATEPDDDLPITAAELAAVIGTDATRAGHILATAWALVARYAPLAPESVHREAIVRCAGWLAQAPASGARREGTGDIDTSWSPNATGALRSSGAMALLSPWKVRRAGAIG